MKYYKITKHFKGGCSLFWASLPKSQRVKKGCWDYQMDEWGENTNGGHNYGYRIYVKPTKTRPRKVRMFKKLVPVKMKLEFNKNYIERKGI